MIFLTLVCASMAFGILIASAWDADNPAHIEEYIHYMGQAEGVNVSKLLKVAQCESGMNASAIHHTQKEYSVGVFQINLKAHTHITKEQALNPFFNIGWAIDRMKEGKWGMWTCYTKFYG